MAFTSILDPVKCAFGEDILPAFYLDLNLQQIIDRVCADWGRETEEFYRHFPNDAQCEQYRREVYADVKRPGMYELLYEYQKQINIRQTAQTRRETTPKKIQRQVWYVTETDVYCKALCALKDGLARVGYTSAGFKDFAAYLDEYISSDSFKALKEESGRLKAQLDGFSMTLTYENNRIVLSQKKSEQDFESFLSKLYPDNEAKLESPFSDDPEITGLEQELFKIFMKKNDAFFKEVESFFGKGKDYTDPVFLDFASEITFYLSFCRFENIMKTAGFDFAEPTVDRSRDFSAKGLYDLALACVNLEKGLPVVSNDLLYLKDDRFFVLTGPNQGGKTTFARSLGQLVFFTKMGLDVPAQAANVYYFERILTHFSVEESVETGRGKLMEELVRLSPMMKEKAGNAFVIINELFTTAANYDAIIMGQQVLAHFTKEGSYGIYVTHLHELVESDDSIVGLSATLDEAGVQCFKIERSTREYEGCAINQVNKYRLTYSQLKERLS